MDAPQAKQTRYWPWVAAAVVVVCGALYGRGLVEAKTALERGASLWPDDPDAAITSYRHAVEWYAPLNPYNRRAVERLEAIGDEASGDNVALALTAYESLRSGILVTRGLTTPHSAVIERIEPRIASLRAEQMTGGDGLETRTAHQLALLKGSRTRAPDPVWSFVASSAFLAWIVLTLLAIRAFGADSHRRRLTLTAASAGSAALWIVGLFLV